MARTDSTNSDKWMGMKKQNEGEREKLKTCINFDTIFFLLGKVNNNNKENEEEKQPENPM